VTPRNDIVAVVGCGLIGGSLLRALHATGRNLLAIDPHEPTRDAIRAQLGVPTSSRLKDAEAAGVIVLALPVPILLQSLRTLGSVVSDQVVTDVGGIKAPVMAEARRSLPATASFVGGHPMAGSERAGYVASSADLFRHRVVALCVPDGNEPAGALVSALWESMGARVVRCDAAVHDAAVARVSHLPHLVAAALARVASHGDELSNALAAGGLRDTTRVAEDPTIRFALALNPRVPGLARETAAELLRLADALERGESVDSQLDEAAAARRRLFPS
jgi:prephenate dehydrogenase